MEDSMFTLRQKLDMLLVISSIEPDRSNYNYKDGWEKDPLKLKMNEQEKLFEELETLAKENNTLLGRILKFQTADSYAIYVVTKVNKNTVRVTWIDWCDGWQDDRLGAEGMLDTSYVQDRFEWEDSLKRVFVKK